MKKIKVVELFSGIGSQARALKNIGANFEIVGTCEWDVHSLVAYDLIHNGNEIHKDAKNLSKQELLDKMKSMKFSLDGKEEVKQSTFKSFRVEVLRKIYSAVLKNKNYVNITDLDGLTFA